MPTEKQSPESVLFSFVKDGKVVECIGRLRRDAAGPYAEGACDMANGVPIPQVFVRLDEKSLRRGRDEQQGQDRYYHRGFVVLDQ